MNFGLGPWAQKLFCQIPAKEVGDRHGTTLMRTIGPLIGAWNCSGLPSANFLARETSDLRPVDVPFRHIPLVAILTNTRKWHPRSPSVPALQSPPSWYGYSTQSSVGFGILTTDAGSCWTGRVAKVPWRSRRSGKGLLQGRLRASDEQA